MLVIEFHSVVCYNTLSLVTLFVPMRRASGLLSVLVYIVCIAVYGYVMVLFQYIAPVWLHYVIEMRWSRFSYLIHLPREAFRRFVFTCSVVPFYV